MSDQPITDLVGPNFHRSTVRSVELCAPTGPEPARDLTRFFTPEGIEESARASGWTAEEEDQILAEIARDSQATGSSRIAAISALRQKRLDALRLSGRLATMTETAHAVSTQSVDGRSAQELTRTIESTTHLLKRFAQSTTIVDSPTPPKELPDEPRPD